MKERIAAIVIGLLMVGSILGFAIMSVRQPVKENVNINIFDRQLSAQEKVAILRTGKVLIEYGWPYNCSQCSQREQLFVNFVHKWPDYVVLSAFNSNQSIEHIIGGNGQIVELENVTTEDGLFAIFCQLAYIQPKECLLLKI
jgi:hypothetical protein